MYEVLSNWTVYVKLINKIIYIKKDYKTFTLHQNISLLMHLLAFSSEYFLLNYVFLYLVLSDYNSGSMMSEWNRENQLVQKKC